MKKLALIMMFSLNACAADGLKQIDDSEEIVKIREENFELDNNFIDFVIQTRGEEREYAISGRVIPYLEFAYRELNKIENCSDNEFTDYMYIYSEYSEIITITIRPRIVNISNEYKYQNILSGNVGQIAGCAFRYQLSYEYEILEAIEIK